MLTGYDAIMEANYRREAELDAVKKPKGYSYRLYKVETRIGPRYAVAYSRAMAERLIPMGGKAAPVLLYQLVAMLGHAGANLLLRQFADNWMTREGMIFYGRGQGPKAI